MDFSAIFKSHIEQALGRLRDGEVPPDFLPSTDYDVVVGHERFPPKQVIALAHHEATGIMPAPSEFKGGKRGRAFNKLEEHGFVIEPKLVSERAWIFQTNPDKFRVDDYLRENQVFCWTLNQHRKEVHAGDRVYVWRSGKDAGVVAVALVEAIVGVVDNLSGYWIEPPTKDAPKVRLKLIEKWVDKPLSRESIRVALPELTILRVPRQTNYSLSAEENHVIERMLGIESLQLARELEAQPSDVSSLPASDREALEVVRGKSGTEGARKLYTHYKRERDTSLGKAAKKAFRAKHSKLCCEACGFEPEPIFGFEIIEAHHRIPLSQSVDGRVTTAEDFILLCPSCHRAIHKIPECDFAALSRLVAPVRRP
jgi:hypothetical protein